MSRRDLHEFWNIILCVCGGKKKKPEPPYPHGGTRVILEVIYLALALLDREIYLMYHLHEIAWGADPI